MYRANLSTMKLLVCKPWVKKLIKEARSIGNIPKRGYKMDDPNLYEKAYTSNLYFEYLVFTPTIWFEQHPNQKKQFYEIIQLIIDKAKIPTHFDRYVEEYIFFNIINAPTSNFVIHHPINSNGKSVFPYPQYFRRPYVEDKKNADKMIKILSENYPDSFTKSLRDLEQEENYKKIEHWNKTERKKTIREVSGEKVNLGTDKSLSIELFGRTKDEKEEKRLYNRTRQLKSRLKLQNKKRLSE